MTATRWTLLVIAALAALAGAIHAMRAPAESPTAAAEPTTTALPLHLPGLAPVDSAPASAASQPAARPTVNTAAARKPSIGSEGYGPHIERAQVGNDAQAAWEAVQWLRNCFANESSRNSFEHARAQGVVPELMTQLMVEADAEARRCQTVTAQHRALLPELAARAMRAGVPEAASAYANSTFPTDLTPAQRQEVADAMRRDAQAGHAQSLLGALTANEAWGLNDAEKLVYLSAYITLPGHAETQTMAKSLIEQGTIRFKTPPTPEQLAVAKPAVLQILERARAGGQP